MLSEAHPMRSQTPPQRRGPRRPTGGRCLLSAVCAAGVALFAPPAAAAGWPLRPTTAGPQDGPQAGSQAAAGRQAALAAEPLGPAALAALAAEVAAEVAQVADGPTPPLEAQLAPPELVAGALRAELQRVHPPDRRAHEGLVAKLLGMLPREADLATLDARLVADDAVGVRDAATGTVLVAEGTSRELARVLLAFEAARALASGADHAAGALDVGDVGGRALEGGQPVPETTDERLARAAVREARAALWVQAWARQRLSAAELEALAAEDRRRARAGEPLPPFVWKPALGLYAQGLAFLARQARYGPLGVTPRAEDVERAVAAPPRTTEELLHPARYWDPAQREAPTPVELGDGELPDGWEVVHEDTLGELVLALFTEPLAERRGSAASALGVAQTRFTNAAADGWDGDRVALARSAGGVFLRVATRWDDGDEAAEFEAAALAIAGELGLGLDVRRDGLFVVLSAAEGAVDPLEWAALDAALTPR